MKHFIKEVDKTFNGSSFKRLGEDVFFGHFIEITRPDMCEIGNHSAIDSFFYSTVPLLIGDYVHIAPQVTVIGGGESSLSVGHFSFVATGTRIVCGSEDYTSGGLMGSTIPKKYKARTKLAPVVFEPLAGCGVNCSILPGVTIAIGTKVGAGSIITKSTEPWAIYVGSPAKLVKYVDAESKAKTLANAKEMGYEF